MSRSFPAFHLVVCLYACVAVWVLLLVAAHGKGEQQGKGRFQCTADGISISLESYTREDPSHEALDKTLWVLRAERDLWHGELLGIHHGESTNRATILHQAFTLAFPTAPRGQYETEWSQVRLLSNKQRPMQFLAHTATEETRNGDQGMLVMLCKPKHLNNTATQQTHSDFDKCLTAPNPLISIAENDKLRTLLLFSSKGAFVPLLFHPHDQCPWSNHSVKIGQGYAESSTKVTRKGYGSSAGLSFFDENTAIQLLELSLNSSLLPCFSQGTFRDRIAGLLDERSAKFTCNEGIKREFVAKNMRNSPLQVYSSMIKGFNGGFEVSPLHDFNLAPGQSAKLLVSYKPDFKAGISKGTLQLVTSAGMVSIAVKANVPMDILEFCQKVALVARAKSFTLQVCSIALFLVLLVFCKMLKQEGDNASGSSESRSAPNRRDSKRSSFYVSINLRCSHDKSKHSSDFWSLGFIYAAMSCIMGSKMSCISQRSTDQDPASNCTRKGQAENIPPSLMNSSGGKKKNSTHPRAFNSPFAVANTSNGNSVLRSTAYLYQRDRAIPRLKIPRPSELESPLSDKKEKAKQNKKRNGNILQVPGMENGSDSGCSSPLSMPSSPLRGTSVSPMSCKTPTFLQSHDKTESSNVSQCHSSRGNRVRYSCGNFSESSRKEKASNSDKKTQNLEKSRDPNQINPSEGKSKNAATRTKCATLTVSHTFPAAGQRFSEGGFQSPQEDGRKWALVASSSSSDLVSTSSVASHAKAPGSPLSANSQSFPNSPFSCTSSSVAGSPLSSSSSSFPESPFSSSPAFSGSPLSSSSPYLNDRVHQNLWLSMTSPLFDSGRGDSCSREGQPFQSRQLNDCNGPRRSTTNLYPRYDLKSAQRKVNDGHHGLEGVETYDMWGNHFADLGRRWRSSWVGKDTPFRKTMPPSPLPPLLQTPAFSIFSSNDPFSV